MSIKPWPLHVHNCWTYDGRIHTKSSDPRRSKLHINATDDQRLLPWGWQCHWQKIHSMRRLPSQTKDDPLVYMYFHLYTSPRRLEPLLSFSVFKSKVSFQRNSTVEYAIIFILALSSSHYFQIESLDGTSIFGCNKYFVLSTATSKTLSVHVFTLASFAFILDTFVVSLCSDWEQCIILHFTSFFFFYFFLFILLLCQSTLMFLIPVLWRPTCKFNSVEQYRAAIGIFYIQCHSVVIRSAIKVPRWNTFCFIHCSKTKLQHFDILYFWNNLPAQLFTFSILLRQTRVPPDVKSLDIVHLNIRSIRNKIDSLLY